MKNFETFTLKSDGRKVVVSTSYVSPLGKIMKISKTLAESNYKGEVLFDLLLSNGFAPNRFLIMVFDGKKLQVNTREIISDISEEVLNELYGFYNEHPQWIEQSSLLDVHKDMLKKNLLMVG
ncbi:Antitoxin to toxin RNase LS or RnlA [Bacillus wiedmannii]|uniref:Antitoxin to toxin RNase LS or RnlA n=1 Tax=Bacillus wiedmannii TaxID=1890302 RepID=A0A1G7FLW8_9BACI|nr:type II toxin-antitoxin system RnlB family antitoxin [Bacillus wiedmannii]MED2879581.1 type II toxin-antitoxin system RnlB family antitoxin [Bacillus thuringiensis]SDE76927.1 Antitoxin to toxin RNase LS or RnlA [Bacillus wiedmannii]